MNLSDIKLKITTLLSRIKVIYIVIVVGLIILFQAVWAYRTIISPNSGSIKPRITTGVVKNAAANIISLETPVNQFKVGDKISVNISIKSNKKTAGTDLIIKYDPNLLSAIASDLKVPVAVGNIYGDYPVNSVDEKLGLIAVSGITSEPAGIIPKGILGTMVFQAKAVGNARIFLEFTKGETNDTNLIENQTAADILEEVKNLDLKIIP